ncbi:MAG TPA: RagB/SusD family nutrient uptake outer membrane protein [Gemmatimonadaceae bacterium]|nr:RagB/SusD family nutrient uptake outer membrane protein [Gemmatimonadaceae bacterium]
MKLRVLAAAFLLVGTASCDRELTLAPTDKVEESAAIVDAASARAALNGAYDALQDGSYYGGDFLFYSDLLSDDVQHTGTFSDFAAADANHVLADNETLLNIWESIYATIGVTNQLIARVPNVPNMDQADKDDIIGQALFIRALSFHNLVKLWGDIPMPLTPAASIAAASEIERTPVAQVYTQILADLAQAETMISNTDTRHATAGAVTALRTRVYLYQQNWQGVIDAADALEADYQLAPEYADLFTPDGNDTPEDIFRVSFTPVEFNDVGFYYLSRSFGGRWEVAPTTALRDTYGVSADPNYDPDTVQTRAAFNPVDPRAAWNIAYDSRNRIFGSKIPTPVGAEDIHVIRFGEVILNKAEALAQRNGAGDLTLAIAEVNRIRARAGVPLLNATGLTQAQVLDLVYRERRLELAEEGFRWPDLVRIGQALTVMNPDPANPDVEQYELLLPIPQADLDVSSKLVQNPGY